jgi:hypothetical protein
LVGFIIETAIKCPKAFSSGHSGESWNPEHYGYRIKSGMTNYLLVGIIVLLVKASMVRLLRWRHSMAPRVETAGVLILN